MSEPAERKPFLVRAGEGESVWSLGGRFTAKATADVTEERFALVESVAFQSTEPPWPWTRGLAGCSPNGGTVAGRCCWRATRSS